MHVLLGSSRILVPLKVHKRQVSQHYSGVNPNAAPGPIPATTDVPLKTRPTPATIPPVRQDNNGVQWVVFEHSLKRVKMEYTIRYEVESVMLIS
jgi:hypothetical protein